MTSASPTLSPQTAVEHACERSSVIGNELRSLLAREVSAKVLLRRAKDVVLLSGPTGSGKEKVGTVCHAAADEFLGRNGKLVSVNCANLQGGLFESQLFGSRRGAFTGADRDVPGLVTEAQGGTLILDEVQALEPTDQARLLRFLGEREYRTVGDESLRHSDALIILSSNEDLRDLVGRGLFRRDLLDRASAKIHVPSLYERRRDIGELAQTFAMEAATDLGVARDAFFGLSRRARADVEASVIKSEEVSVRRLREIIRDCVFMAAADRLPEVLESDFVVDVLEREFGFAREDADALDRAELESEFTDAVARAKLHELAKRHGTSTRALDALITAIETMINEMEPGSASYRNVVERNHRMMKVALWLVSKANTQAEFRKYFGSLNANMPTKSVAHQIFYEVFPKKGGSQ